MDEKKLKQLKENIKKELNKIYQDAILYQKTEYDSFYEIEEHLNWIVLSDNFLEKIFNFILKIHTDGYDKGWGDCEEDVQKRIFR